MQSQGLPQRWKKHEGSGFKAPRLQL